MAAQDIETIYAFFGWSVIREESGKLRAPSPQLAWLIKRWIKVGARVTLLRPEVEGTGGLSHSSGPILPDDNGLVFLDFLEFGIWSPRA